MHHRNLIVLNMEFGKVLLGSMLCILYINDMVNISNACKYILLPTTQPSCFLMKIVFNWSYRGNVEIKKLVNQFNLLVINKVTINFFKTSYIIFNKPKLNLIITLDNMIIV